jgi:hypothetical protein
MEMERTVGWNGMEWMGVFWRNVYTYACDKVRLRESHPFAREMGVANYRDS